MKTRLLHDKKQIEEFLRRDPYLHIYALGDLDDFFWPHTTWHALCEDGSIGQIALVYSGAPLPVLLGFASDPVDGMRELLASAAHLLPPRLYAHLSPGTAPALAGHFRIRYHGTYLKMAWTDRSRVDLVDTTDVVSLSSADWREVQAFYAESYPGNWFDPRILATGACRGLRSEGRLVSVAGVPHLHSRSSSS